LKVYVSLTNDIFSFGIPAPANRSITSFSIPHVIGLTKPSGGVPKEKISFVRDTYTFNFAGAPSELVDAFRKYYGPTMNAFEAAEKNGRAGDLQKELEVLFNSQNKSPSKDATSIPATFLRVTVALN
jgi:hypothetical protein